MPASEMGCEDVVEMAQLAKSYRWKDQLAKLLHNAEKTPNVGFKNTALLHYIMYTFLSELASTSSPVVGSLMIPAGRLSLLASSSSLSLP